MKNLVKNINPPGYEKTNRGRLFRIIQRLGDIAASDALHVLKNFFPLLADEKALSEHGESLMIPRYSSDTEDTYRARVATAAFYMVQRGTRGFLRTEIGKNFSERQLQIIEEWMHLTVKVLDMTEGDRAWLKEFLYSELDPNIAITLVDWFVWVEDVEFQDSQSFLVANSGIDCFDTPLSYDGRILHDHGEAVTASRMIAFNGSQDYSGQRACKGTSYARRYLDLMHDGLKRFSGIEKYDGSYELPCSKLSGPAYYNGENDALDIRITEAI